MRQAGSPNACIAVPETPSATSAICAAISPSTTGLPAIALPTPPSPAGAVTDQTRRIVNTLAFDPSVHPPTGSAWPARLDAAAMPLPAWQLIQLNELFATDNRVTYNGHEAVISFATQLRALTAVDPLHCCTRVQASLIKPGTSVAF